MAGYVTILKLAEVPPTPLVTLSRCGLRWSITNELRQCLCLEAYDLNLS